MRIHFAFVFLIFILSGIAGQTPRLKKEIGITERKQLIKMANRGFGAEVTINFSISTSDIDATDKKRSGETPASEKQINEILSKLKYEPSDLSLYNQVGMLYKRMNQPEKASEYFLKALEISTPLLARYPDSAELHQINGMIQMNHGDNSAAIKSFERTLLYKPTDTIAGYFLPMLYLGIGDTERLNFFLEERLKEDPSDPNLLLYRCLFDAFSIRSEVPPDSANEPDYFYRLSTARFLKYPSLSTALFKDPDKIELQLLQLYFTNFSYLLKGAFSSKQGYFFRFRPEELKEIEVTRNRLVLLLSDKRVDNKYSVYKNIGIAELQLGNAVKSREAFRSALKYFKNYSNTVWTNNAECYDGIIASHFLEKDTVAAWKALMNKIENQPAVDPSAEDLIRNAGFYFSNQQFQKTGAEARKVIKINPSSDEAYLAIALVSMNEGNFTDSKKQLDTAYRINKFNPGIFRTLGIIGLLENDITTAHYAFQQVLALYPRDEDVLKIIEEFFEN